LQNPTTVSTTAQTFTLTSTNSITGCSASEDLFVDVQKPTAQFTLDKTSSSTPPFVVKPHNASYPLPLTYDWEMLDTIPVYYD
jgi:secreted PhoX family phosphatase